MSVAMLSLLLFASSWQKVQAQDVTVSYQTFYDNLSPYGQWVNDPQYGNVFVPNEGGDFRPYGSRGHWVMTDYGNTWVSDDPWGWACYHYGRWTYDPYYGWVWIPGYEWAPAWVSWRFGGGYCGWAPLGPGVGLAWECPQSWWVFVGPEYMYQPNCIHYWRGPNYNNTYIRQTTIVNNYYVDNGTHVRYNYGPRGEEIQRVTHQPVTVYHVSQSTRPGAPGISGNRVSIYRPAVNRATVNAARPTNVLAAPRALGAPQNHNNISAGKQPAFRQQIRNKAPNSLQPGNRPQQAVQPAQRPQPAPQQRQQPDPQQRPQPAPQQRPQPMPQQHQQPQPQERPQPKQRPQPAPQERPQPQQRPQPQERPQPQQRPQPMPQPQQRPQPMPQERPPMQQPPREAPREEPREGGRR